MEAMVKQMSENITNTQKGSNNMQIGEQNNFDNIDSSVQFHIENTSNDNSSQIHVDNRPNIFIGPSLEDVTRIVTNLFLDNFPRMQMIAKEEAEKRMNELWYKIVECLTEKGVTNLTPFMETDVQYVLYEAQKNYARFATPDLLSKLSSLIAERIKHDGDDMCLKVAIDQAISVIGMLTPAHLDYLSALFLTTKVKFANIQSLEQLKKQFDYIDNTFSKSKFSNWQHLNMLGCLQLDLPNVCKYNAKLYNFNVTDVEKICPKNIKDLSGDYSTSPIGTIIAMTHAEQKTFFRFDPKIWIHN